MYGFKRLSEIRKTSDIIEFDQNSRFVLMSDCHRGDGTWADDFAKNQTICSAALEHYYHEHYTYIEIGDGDELWENKRMGTIINAHKDIFFLLTKFYERGRMIMLFGNHDIAKKNCRQRGKSLFRYYDAPDNECKELFKELIVMEGLILKNAENGREIFLAHGHQVDFLNNFLWRMARFLVRHLWRRLELFGVNDPTSAASNNRKKDKIEKKLSQWVSKENCLLIAGHTHRPVLPAAGESRYFNDGSCVHPNGITAIEIADSKLTLVKWLVKAKQDGTLYVGREILVGPAPIKDFYNKTVYRRVKANGNGCPV